MSGLNSVVIIGAGVGGLSTAAELSKSGLDVTVLEAHVDPGGCAATFFHKGFRFDAGATLAGGFSPGAPMDLLGQRFGIDWQAQSTDIAMQVHLSDGTKITRWTDPHHWQHERQFHFGRNAENFWHWQENTADKLWQLTNQFPPWPPQNPNEFISLASIGLNWLWEQSPSYYLQLTKDTFQNTSKRFSSKNENLRQFIDAQLLISAQATSRHANSLYSAAALDLARLGVSHLPGGMGSISSRLADAIRDYGGKINYRQTVNQVRPTKAQKYEVKTHRGETFLADTVIFNLTPWNINLLLDKAAPQNLTQLPEQPKDAWGAFMIYAGVPKEIIPEGFPLHQQVVVQEPLGEGNSIFLSLSPDWDKKRAPEGFRAATISTHTRLAPWWQLHNDDIDAYEARKNAYTERIMTAADQLLPGFYNQADLVLPGTPVTFQRFTHRAWGWVGGFPQTSLFRAWKPRLAPGLWMVGDSIFPGQSVPAVALGGLRVAQGVLKTYQKTQFSFRKLFPQKTPTKPL